MRTAKSPRLGSRLLLGIMLVGTAAPAMAASYSLELHAEAPIGKYTAELSGSLAGALSYYHPLAMSALSTRVWTFCLESEVYFQSGRTYGAELSGATDSLPAGDPLSVGSAYLYEKFALGALASVVPDFTYDVAGGERLQRMIWWLEDEAGGVPDAEMWSVLDVTFGGTAKDAYTGTAVGVLNLTRFDGPGGDSLPESHGIWRQDQIFYRGPGLQGASLRSASVPDGGGTLALFAISLVALRVVRRIGRSE